MENKTTAYSLIDQPILNLRLNQAGTSLVEVMLASALGLFLIFGFIQIYLSVQKTFNLQQAIIGIQENGRFAVHFLNESIRMAGYAYCGSSTDFVNQALAIKGYSDDAPVFLTDIKKGTDSIEVGECVVRDKKQQFEKFIFYIGKTDRKNSLGNSIYALYVKYSTDTANKRELVSGVEDMQLSYGIVEKSAAKNIADYLLATAMKAKDWQKVRAVKIALLLNSEQPVLLKPETYDFFGKKFPASRLLRREWHIYVALREQ
jgi:hypothetical protein